MSAFQNACSKAIYDKLAADNTLTALLSGGTAVPSVYEDIAPQGTDCPYVVFQVQSPSVPVRTSVVAYENALVTVKAVTQSQSAASAGTISARIDTLLDGPPLTYTGFSHVRCSRLQDVKYPEVGPGGELYRHQGATYRIQARQ